VPNRFVIVLPTYNECDNLQRVVEAIGAERARTPFPGDVLVVDDASPDGTGELADELAATHPWLHVLHRPDKRGLGRAYVDGFRWALERDYTHILEMDADLSHPPDAIPRLLKAAADADLVLGSRYVAGGGVTGWPPHRRVISRGGSLYARTLLGVSVRDLTGGFKCFHRRVLENADLDSVHGQGYVFQIELTYRTLRMGGRVSEVPITFCDRTAGTSKMTLAIVAEAVWKVPALRLRGPRGAGDRELRPGSVASLVASRPPL
jgi:dolichol-phosphate mannosyltransferase